MPRVSKCPSVWVPWVPYFFIFIFFFFLSGVSFTDTDDSQDSWGRKGTIFYFTLPLPPAHEHSGIYLQLCMWDDYHIFLIATLAFTRLILDEILPPYRITIWLIDDANFFFSLFTRWFDTRFLLQQSWYGKTVDSNLHRLSPLYYKQTD